LALRGRQRQRGWRWDCQQFRQQRNRGCVRRRPFGEQGAEFLDPRTWQVRGGEAGGATQMTLRPRIASLLSSLEGFDIAEVAGALDCSIDDAASLIDAAGKEIAGQIRTDVLII